MSDVSILIVDDSFDNLEVLIKYIKEFGSKYKIFKAPNGKIAYDIVLTKEIDIILTDWEMPVMNGIQLIQKVKENPEKKYIPIVMVTGAMQSAKNLKKALKSGAVDYLRKPVDSVELFARIQSAYKISKNNKQLLEKKNNELVENTLLLIQNNKFNISITSKLKTLHSKIENKTDDIDDLFDKIINEIDKKVRKDIWQRFEFAFKSVNITFKKNLFLKFPNLTPTEVKFCIFIRMEMNTKDIASILYQSAGSVKVTRSRLRRKLNLTTDQNLQTFLSSL